MLTDKEILALKPREKKYKVFDADGLFLVVHPKGGKYWYLKYHCGGGPKRWLSAPIRRSASNWPARGGKTRASNSPSRRTLKSNGAGLGPPLAVNRRAILTRKGV